VVVTLQLVPLLFVVTPLDESTPQVVSVPFAATPLDAPTLRFGFVNALMLITPLVVLTLQLAWPFSKTVLVVVTLQLDTKQDMVLQLVMVTFIVIGNNDSH
jgi:hypothetical protein